jgi:phenylpyruvate tautomerase PptA (4-oxalocrotonate tautomerase family)
MHDTTERIENSDSLPRADGLSRRNVLMTATAAAGALAVAQSALADAGPAGAFGAPIVEFYVPAGVLSPEQRSAMIRSLTDVVLGVMQPPPDPKTRLYVEIIETAAGGWGVNGEVFVPRSR